MAERGVVCRVCVMVWCGVVCVDVWLVDRVSCDWVRLYVLKMSKSVYCCTQRRLTHYVLSTRAACTISSLALLLLCVRFKQKCSWHVRAGSGIEFGVGSTVSGPTPSRATVLVETATFFAA